MVALDALLIESWLKADHILHWSLFSNWNLLDKWIRFTLEVIFHLNLNRIMIFHCFLWRTFYNFNFKLSNFDQDFILYLIFNWTNCQMLLWNLFSNRILFVWWVHFDLEFIFKMHLDWTMIKFCAGARFLAQYHLNNDQVSLCRSCSNRLSDIRQNQLCSSCSNWTCVEAWSTFALEFIF